MHCKPVVRTPLQIQGILPEFRCKTNGCRAGTTSFDTILLLAVNRLMQPHTLSISQKWNGLPVLVDITGSQKTDPLFFYKQPEDDSEVIADKT